MLDRFSRSVLDFERGWWLHGSLKDASVQEVLGCSAADYYQHLSGLIEDPSADAYDPLTIRRLRRTLAGFASHPAVN